MQAQNDPETIFKPGITDNQIAYLIQESKSDLLIKKFTRDTVRFKNKTTFKRWQKNKIIYTLTDKSDNLLGIAWFSEKTTPEFPDYRFSVAIRIYKSGRGKGYSKIFLSEAIKSFTTTTRFREAESPGIWLSVNSKNMVAKKVYKILGFKAKKQTDGVLYMRKKL